MQMIEVNKLIPHSRNNEFFDDITGDNWTEFKKSIETSGVIEPVIITQDKVIVSGHQRVKACNELGISEIPCEVKIYESDQQIIKDLLETNLRQRGVGNTNAIKLGRCIVELEKIYGIKVGNPQLVDNPQIKTQSELASEIGLSIDQVKGYKRLLTLIPELQSMIEDGELVPTIGYKVLSKLTKEQQEKLIEEVGKDYISQLTQKKAEELVKNVKPQVIDKTDYTTIDTLRKSIQHKDKNIELLKKDKDILEKKVKLNDNEIKKYNEIKQQIEVLSKTKNDIGRQIESATSLAGLVIEVDHFIKTKLAPVQYSKALLDTKSDDIVIKNLREILEVVESWCSEIKKYLPNDMINITNYNVEEIEND